MAEKNIKTDGVKAEAPKAPAKAAAPKAASKPAAEKKAAAPKKAVAPKTAAKADAAKKTPTAEKPVKKVSSEETKAAPAEKVTAPKVKAAGDAKKKAIRIRLLRSLSGRLVKQVATAKALGLRRIGDTTTQPDNAATRGKIAKISHMVEVTEL